MALTRTQRAAAQSSNPGTASFTPAGTFTPTANALLVCSIIGVKNSGGATPSDDFDVSSVTGGGLTWTKVGGRAFIQDWDLFTFVYYAWAPSSPSAMQVTVDAGSYSIYSYMVRVDEYTGADTTTPIDGFASATFTGAKSGSEALAATPTADDVVWVLAGEDDDGAGGTDIGEPSGWTTVQVITSGTYGMNPRWYTRTGTTAAVAQFAVSNTRGYGPALWQAFIVRAGEGDDSQNVGHSLLTSTTTFGAHTVQAGDLNVATLLLTSTTVLGSHSATPGVYPIVAVTLTSTTVLPSPTLGIEQTIRPPRLTSTPTFGAHVVTVATRTYRFTPPTVENRYDPRTDPCARDGATRAIARWFVRHDTGVAVLRTGDTFVERHHPSHAELEAADDYWLGGHSHIVDQATATALGDAGYTVELIEED